MCAPSPVGTALGTVPGLLPTAAVVDVGFVGVTGVFVWCLVFFLFLFGVWCF